MNRSVTRALTFAVAAALLVGLPGLPAGADRPVFRDHVKLRHDLHEVPQLTQACGFDVWHEERVNVVLRFFEDGTVEARLSVHETLVNPDTGATLEHLSAGGQTVRRDERVEGDTLVVDIDARHVGLPSHWRRPGEGVLLRDAGLVELDVRLVVDLSQDPPQVLERDVDVRLVHGPHPEVEMSNEEFYEFVCGELS